jgi:hypothetical protein
MEKFEIFSAKVDFSCFMFCFGRFSALTQNLVTVQHSDGDFGKYFHLPVSVNFGKWILFTGTLPVNKKNQLTP